MKRAMASAGLFSILACGMYGQNGGTVPEFDAVSVKPTTQEIPSAGMMAGGGRFSFRMGCSGGPGTDDPGRYTCTAANLRMLVTQAWGIENYRVFGPSTLDSERFDIAAKIPEGATRDQFRLMLQKMIVDRFHMVLHHEDRELPVYSLTIAKNGHKLQAPKEGDTETAMEAMQKDRAGDGPNPALRKMAEAGSGSQTGQVMMMVGRNPTGRGRGGPIATMMSNGEAQMIGRRATMTDLTRQLSNQLDKPVVDETGLAGEWNFTLQFAADSIGGRGMGPMIGAMQSRVGGMSAGAGSPSGTSEATEPSAAPPLPNALEKQLGLKLESKKAPADTIVVDKLEKVPTEN